VEIKDASCLDALEFVKLMVFKTVFCALLKTRLILVNLLGVFLLYIQNF